MLFFQFFNSPVALKNNKKFCPPPPPQEKVEMTPLLEYHQHIKAVSPQDRYGEIKVGRLGRLYIGEVYKKLSKQTFVMKTLIFLTEMILKRQKRTL